MDYTVSDDISPQHIANKDILRLHKLWCRLGTDAGGLPALDSVDVDSLWCANDLMLVERAEATGFKYIRYGSNISLASGFDMTGKCTSEFASSAGRFFTGCYEQCLTERRPLYATNPASHAALVNAWERLLLPLDNAKGAPHYVLGYNRPLSFKHELLSRVLDATAEAIMGLGTLTHEDGRIDFQVLTVNRAAQQLLGRKDIDLLGQRLSQVARAWLKARLAEPLKLCVSSGNSARHEWLRLDGTVHRWYRVAIDALRDGAVVSLSNITEAKKKEQALEAANRELERLANTDSLTGVNNRRRFLSVAQAEIARAERYDAELSIVLVDIDRFKVVNDRHGHDAGDRVLRALVYVLQQGLRTSDTLGRIGGEEFGLILPHTNETMALETAERLCALVAAYAVDIGAETSVSMTCSFGVARYAGGKSSVEALLRLADKALYEAKAAGRNCVNSAAS